MNGASCEGALFASGALGCNTGYSCAGAAGARTCRGAACDDGLDNDGDGKFDFPEDPGCDSVDDISEADPATTPVCADGMDNDTDTLIDWPRDYGCVAASGSSEKFCPVETNPTSLITSALTTGTTVGMTNNFATQTCQSSAASADIVYALSLPEKVKTLTVDTVGSTFDTVLSVRDAQCGVELGCDDDGATSGERLSKLTLSNLPRGNLAIIVDGYSGGSGGAVAGSVKLNVKGTVAAQTAGSSPLFSGGANAILSCPTGTTCTGMPAKCQ